jgi:AcrR family transcriptional regulator
MAKATYHHGDLRQSLIDCACQQLMKDSADHLSLRALAREAGVSQTAPYRHFETKNALFAAVATYGFELMTEHLRAASEAYPDDVERAVNALGLAYVEWALENPEKYQLFFDSSLVDFGSYDELHEAGCACFEVLLELIQRGIQEKIFVDDSPEFLAGTLWSSVHGLASLLQSKDPRAMEKRRDAVVVKSIMAMAANPEQVINMFVNSIRR